VNEILQRNDSDYKRGENNWFYPLLKAGLSCVAMESNYYSPLTG